MTQDTGSGWGGKRPNTGGKRHGAGRLQQRIMLDLETARILRELVRQWNAETPEAKYTPQRLVTGFIYIDAMKRGLLDLDEHWQKVIDGEDEKQETVEQS